MMFDAKKISAAIRAKKKKVAMGEPELVDAGLQPDLNPNDLMHLNNKAMMEETLKTPKKIDADETAMNDEDHGMGFTPEQLTRMSRLRKYAETLDV